MMSVKSITDLNITKGISVLQRAALNSQNLTRVTLESFLKWKQKKAIINHCSFSFHCDMCICEK